LDIQHGLVPFVQSKHIFSLFAA